MNYLTNYFGGGNTAGGMRKPSIGQGMDLYGGQPSMNLGMTMPSTPFPTDMGTGLKPPSSFGQMPAGFDWKSALSSMGSLLGKQEEQQQPQMKPVELPMGSNQNYEELLKMYGVRSGGLLG